MMPTDYQERVAGLDLATKVSLLTGASAFATAPRKDIGLGVVRLSDGPNGVRGPRFSGGQVAALLPNATLLSASWSEDTAAEVGRLLAEEAKAAQIHVVLGPTMSMHRSLLGGRVFESFSEDPLLTGRLAAAFVRGLQGQGVAACPKALIANDSETERSTMNTIVAEGALRQLYLLPFQMAVRDGQAWAMMAAYNRVNGVLATEQHHVLTDIVKDEWGYDGLIMSDWEATQGSAAATAGLDLVMPGPEGPWGESLVDAVRAGSVEESLIDDHVTRLLRLADAFRARLGDRCLVSDGVEVYTRPTAARPGFVTDPHSGGPGIHLILLDKDGAVLEERHDAAAAVVVGFDDDFDRPVTAVHFRARVHEPGSVQLGGLGAGQWRIQVAAQVVELVVPQGESSAPMVAPPHRLVDVEARAGDLIDATVTLAPWGPEAAAGLFGLIAGPAPRATSAALDDSARTAAGAELAVVVVGLTEEQESESVDKTTLRLPGDQDALVRTVAATARRTVVVVNAATPVLMPGLSEVDAVLWAGLPGQEAGYAVAAALFGDIEPAGRLASTFPARDGAAPAWSVTPHDGELHYEEGLFIGYRGHHAGLAAPPAFWFGHGLGYSTWTYSSPELTGDGSAAVVELEVTNTGVRRSREVVQLYLDPPFVHEPVRLIGWTSLTADPGQIVGVRVQVDPRSLTSRFRRVAAEGVCR